MPPSLPTENLAQKNKVKELFDEQSVSILIMYIIQIYKHQTVSERFIEASMI